jgi:predicted transposase/invertase (TIGR01784 family)
LPCSQYHSVFRLLETQRHELLTDALTLHFVELPKVPQDLLPSAEADPVLKWACFFNAKNDEERHRVAMSDPTLHEAEVALRKLSDDPIAREYAYRRELEQIHLQDQLTRRFELGREEGREAILTTVTRLCTTFDIELNDARRAQLTALDFPALRDVAGRIIDERTWPL